jgi:UTP--glucose-1-phosphate uridylyltransferase
LQARTGGIVIALLEVEPELVSRYGICSVEPAGAEDGDDVVRVTGLVEKPALEDAPSNLAIIGRYVLPFSIFDAIRGTGPGSGGEIQLTDAMASLLAAGAPLGYLQAVVQLACQRDDLGAAFRGWLGEFVNKELV